MKFILQIFDSPEPKQYFLDDGGILWLHGTLLSKRLGFSKPAEAIQMHTEPDERRQVETGKMGKLPWFVNEYGVWGMILAARTPEANEFKRYLKYEVLPAIRKDGGYVSPEATDPQLDAIAEKVANIKLERANRLHARLCWTDVVKDRMVTQGTYSNKTLKVQMFTKLTRMINKQLFKVPDFHSNRDLMTLDQQNAIITFETLLVVRAANHPKEDAETLVRAALMQLQSDLEDAEWERLHPDD